MIFGIILISGILEGLGNPIEQQNKRIPTQWPPPKEMLLRMHAAATYHAQEA